MQCIFKVQHFLYDDLNRCQGIYGILILINLYLVNKFQEIFQMTDKSWTFQGYELVRGMGE